jgi:hypothetical protein
MKATQHRKGECPSNLEASCQTIPDTQAGAFGRPGAILRMMALRLTLGVTALLVLGAYARDLDPQLVAKWPGFYRGGAGAVAAVGSQAYVAVSGRLACVGDSGYGAGAGSLGALTMTVLDVGDPANPRPLGEVRLSESASSIAMWDHYAFVAAGWAGLHLVDLSNPARPQRVGGIRTFDANAVAVHDGRAFVANSDGMSILDQFTPLRFGARRAGAAGNLVLSLTLSGVSGERVRVERSANSMDWDDWQTLVLGSIPTELRVETIGLERQFFRALEVPPRP